MIRKVLWLYRIKPGLNAAGLCHNSQGIYSENGPTDDIW